MKKLSLIASTLALFSLSIYLAFMQGSTSGAELHSSATESVLTGVQVSPLVYTGFKAEVAKIFSVVFNSLMQMTGGSVLISIVILAIAVELILLYPSVRIQLKQKKIHLFHKKLVDRFNSGELSVGKAEDELHKIYDVNEKIHHRGAILVAAQIALFFFTFWGLNLMVKVPEMLYGSWNILNFSLLSKATNIWIPITASMIYLVHSITKIHFKTKEDYINAGQIITALVFALVGSVIVYLFAGIFAVALSLYFITLITFSTIRYILVEKYTENWNRSHVQKELMQMLREAQPHKNRFQYFSRLWKHLPIVRHINFNLLEEALSMSLGILLAMNLLT